MLTNVGAHAFLNVFKLTAISMPSGFWVSMLTTLPDNTGSGAVEASYSGYARVRFDTLLGAAASKQITNSGGAITFTQVPTSTGTIARGFGIHDAASSGSLWFAAPFATQQRSFSAAASGDALTVPGNDFLADDPVRIFKTDDSTVPAGLSEGVTYYVRNISGITFKLATAPGGSAIDITADGCGDISRVIEQPLNAGVTPQFSTSAFIISFDK